MLQVKSCNVKHTSESVFRYFASAVNNNQSTKCDRKDLYVICKYSSLNKVDYVPLYIFRKSLFDILTATGLLESPCIAHQPDGIHPVQIHLIGIRDRHLITAASVIKRLRLYEFTTLRGRDFVFVVRIRESRYYGGFFLKKIYENMSGHWKLSVIERSPYQRGVRTERFDCILLYH